MLSDADRTDVIQTLARARGHCECWFREGKIHEGQWEAIAAFYDDWQQRLAEDSSADQELPGHLPPLQEGEAGNTVIEELRSLVFLGKEVEFHEKAGRLSLSQFHMLLTELRGRAAALKSTLARQGITEVSFLTRGGQSSPGHDADQAPTTPVPKRHILEILLDPRSIQYLMMFGGSLLVLGLVIWLWAVGVFANKLVIATAMGGANIGVLAVGWAVLSFSRYQTAGRGITLLACLIMPLNLWFYDAQGLITLREGGHLWIPALVCCALYALTARVLRDPLFVYTFVGGVTMTGLLILADQDVARFWEIAAPSTLLAVLGLLCIHAERAFSPSDGPFSRQRFGLAFFWSGHAVLAVGLLLLLAGQLAGWLYGPLLESWGLLLRPAIVQERSLQLIALALVLAATYAYVYSDLVVRRIGVYIYLAVFTLLWAELLAVNIFAVQVTIEVAIVAFAVTALTANLLQPLAATRAQGTTGSQTGLLPSPISDVGVPLGWFLATCPVLLGVLLYLRATYQVLYERWPYHVGWWYVAAMLVTAISCRVGAHVYRHRSPKVSGLYFLGTAAATLVGAAGLLSLLGLTTWDVAAPGVMIVPILYIIAARCYRGHSAEKPLIWVGHIATEIMILAVVGAALQWVPAHVVEPVRGARTNLLLAVFFAEATLFYILAAAFARQGFSIYLATATASGAIWQLLCYRQVPEHFYILTFAIVGLMLLIGYRFALLEKSKSGSLASAAFQCGNTLLSLACVAATLFTLSRLTADVVEWSLISMLVILLGISLAAVVLVYQEGWRRWYVTTAVAEALLIFLVLNVLSELTIWQKAEVFSIATGLLLLLAGHLGWYREQDSHNGLVSLALFLGSTLACVPLVIAVVIQRATNFQVDFTNWALLNEIAILAIGLLLLASGILFQLRSTTIFGAGTMLVYLLSLVFFLRLPEKLQNVAVYMMIGGGVLFGIALLLSIYRDHLVALPERISKRQGVFRVLSWR